MSTPSISRELSPSSSPGAKEPAQVMELDSPSGPNPPLSPSRWSQIREIIKEPAAEFVGTAILVFFGNGVLCQALLSRNTNVTSMAYGDFLSVNFGFAVGLALGAWVTTGFSQGHINPAVTIAMATFRPKAFPWRKVPAYVFAQLMGGLCGAGIVYANYIHAIDLFEGGRGVRTVPGTAGLFATYAVGGLRVAFTAVVVQLSERMTGWFL
ncbi:transporter [Ganoderma sinense ZZ0214-1]|uniref:Transporter n=1 Tax=Ganoderma sinense ZZ0214-1 TaxID=1077348 RepID=A0A2G8S989_9APHY|nr:transporter [Ganoderma sinense ZZ0214-1]